MKHVHAPVRRRKNEKTNRTKQTIFWIAILSSSSVSDINQTRQYLLREQSNHTQSLILKTDWTESLKQFLEPDQQYYLLEKLLVIQTGKEISIPQTQFQSKLQLLFDYLIGALVEVPKKKRKKNDFVFDLEREI